MGAGRMNEVEYTKTLDRLISAFCQDYERRRSAIESGKLPIRTEMEYKYLNHRIFEGAAEVVGAQFAEIYINEIGSGVGYAKSDHPASCESGYKREKREVKLAIAAKLHLL